MEPYDLRLLRRDGSLICLIRTQAWSDSHARAVVEAVKCVAYERLEIWRGDALVLCGSRFPTVFAPTALRPTDSPGNPDAC